VEAFVSVKSEEGCEGGFSGSGVMFAEGRKEVHEHYKKKLLQIFPKPLVTIL